MRPEPIAKIVRVSEVEPTAFGPLSEYRRLTGQDGHPLFTGVQTCAPGYATPLHWHPYVESLFILEGTMEAELEGQAPVHLHPGDMIAIPACAPHIFRTHGTETLRLLGIHASPARIVNVISDQSATL